MTDFNTSDESVPRFDNGGIADQQAREALLDRVHGDTLMPSPEEVLASAEEAVRTTFAFIQETLVVLRQERDDINESIAELVEAESVWRPIIHRLDRARTTEAPAEEDA